MKTKNLFILLALAGMVFSCTPKAENSSNNTEYFRHIQFTETPYDQITGIYPLSKEEAKKINHYRFDYNENGKLAEVSFRRDMNLLSYSSLGSPMIKIEYLPGKEVQTYFDKDGTQQKRVGAWKAVYKLDENGNRTGLSFEDKDGNTMTNRNEIAYYTWKVLDDGMVQEKRYDMKDEETIMNPFCPFYELRFSYDNTGRPVRMANYMADTLYDCTAENCGDIGVSYFTFKNNEKGGLTYFSVHNTRGQLSNLYSGWAKFENKLDENGNVLERVSYDQDDELLSGKSMPINAYVYDDYGSVVETNFLDKNRNPFENDRGAATIRYSYDKIGNPVDTVYLSAAKEVVPKS